MANDIRVLLVEDELIVGEAIRALLEETDGIVVIDDAGTAEAAVRKARTLKPDVILVDLLLPDKPGIHVIETIMDEDPTARILVLTAFSDDSRVAAAFQAGALGYVLKTQASEELVQAIQTAYRGLSALHPSIATKLVRQLKRPIEAPAEEALLTEPEERVLMGIARGLSNQEIADELGLSLSTVRTHVSKILSKLHLDNRTQAALHALRKGIVDLAQVRVAHVEASTAYQDDDVQ
ncbi:MAG: DNA-binding response regulator [Chloroflexi bacterium]|nr:MAG: DNA-binding response regulator [Chloroflexota bacterium]